MDRQEVEKAVIRNLKPIFGFALKRCKSIEDAQDLSQEIACKAFKALIIKDDVEDMSRFIWTIAHNSLSNYYRSVSKCAVGIPLDEIFDEVKDRYCEIGEDDDNEAIDHLHREIAYLSKLQRRIVISYYFDNRKQSDIAEELGIPLGTVKWHLFEAKKELKRGMDIMREASDLKFNPIVFDSYGINGSVGTKALDDFFRSALPQNICYCVRDTAKTINEIADALGVSPVYVETEVEILEKYGFLRAQKDKYISDFIISEPDEKLLVMTDIMYKQAAKYFANDLYDELTTSGILDDPDIICGCSDDWSNLEESDQKRRNFILWALITYIAARSGEELMDKSISFDEVATLRPDGGYNIYRASVVTKAPILPDDYVQMKNWCGPMWNSDGSHVFWQINSQWSDREVYGGLRHQEDAKRVLSLYAREFEGRLSKDDYLWLAERGYVKIYGDYDGMFKSSWQIVILSSKEIQNKLIAIGDRIKRKYKSEFDAVKAPYVKAALDSVQKHMRKTKAYELQFLFHSDGMFILHCITELLKNGKLKEPEESQRKALTTLIAYE